MSDPSISDAPKTALSIEVCIRLTEASAAAPDTAAFYPAVDVAVARTIGHRLFTISRFHPSVMELERVYSSDLEAYPAGGRKKKGGTAWSDRVLRDGDIFIGRDNAAIRDAFDDHAKIIALGLGSIINVPVRIGPKILGTMNVTHREGWYTEGDRNTARLLAAFLAPWLLTESETRRATN